MNHLNFDVDYWLRSWTLQCTGAEARREQPRKREGTTVSFANGRSDRLFFLRDRRPQDEIKPLTEMVLVKRDVERDHL